MIEAIKRTLATPEAVCVVFVPDHALAAEFAARLERALGPGVPVGIWRGLTQQDPGAPPGTAMCQRHADVAAVTAAGGSTTDVCGSKVRGHCRHHPAAGGCCGYIAQKGARNRVWVLTHSMLHRPAPAAMRRYTTNACGGRAELPPADLVLIDEKFWPALLAGVGPKPAALDPQDLADPLFAGVPAGGAVLSSNPAGSLGTVLRTLATLIAGLPSGARLTKQALDATGLAAFNLTGARVLALRCKKPLPDHTLPGAPSNGVAVALVPSRPTTGLSWTWQGCWRWPLP